MNAEGLCGGLTDGRHELWCFVSGGFLAARMAAANIIIMLRCALQCATLCSACSLLLWRLLFAGRAGGLSLQQVLLISSCVCIDWCLFVVGVPIGSLCTTIYYQPPVAARTPC